MSFLYRIRGYLFLKKIMILTLAIILSIGTAACSKKATEKSNGSEHVDMTFMHIHGLGYSTDGKQLFIPVHNGLNVYADGVWSEGLGEKHDYMGFTAADNGFYSSGHPAAGSTYKNPLGLIKSTNEGKSITVLALEGEVDLHGMTVGYRTHTIYVLNPQPNSKMKQPGLYYSQDEGQTWTSSPMTGIQGEITAINAHPDERSIVVIGTTDGAFISYDYGQSLTALASDHPVTALAFTNSGDVLIASSKPEASLVSVNIETKTTVVMKTPSSDVISYVAQNPTKSDELAIATEQKDIYISTDSGATWKEIAKKGDIYE
ncbi:F510_1955 family glycosylhydrolase [Paenibacillus sp. LHD-38]|uniref:F510_1955 family glycosylhydrolase n=1 Tax=Paenibacillus sp. LHD-38 TaxID=3072143 RepID=UPI00280D6625|nr:glycosyl hydrolase [Paenibacillus sp. LHD-38]MDQ8734860.1 glycosyl hydrolase [Paenibacillus sp. LHD-38]